MRRAFSERASLFAAGLLLPALMGGCQPTYSPDTYASVAAQQAAKVDQGVVVGVRAVQISADTTLVTGTVAAAGGIAGSQMGNGVGSAFGALGGTAAGGVVGNVVGHAQGDTDGYEYVIRKDNSTDMISVTQKDLKPLGIGAHVLVIQGPQARVVPDYTVPVVSQSLHPDAPKAADAVKPAADALKSAPADMPKPADIIPAKPVETAPIPAPSQAVSPAPASSSTPAPSASPSPPAASAPAASSPAPAKPDDASPPPNG
jgi:outer membrane lipoprotein SlyB